MFKFNTLFALFIFFSCDINAKDFNRNIIGTVTSYESKILKASYDSNTHTYIASHGSSNDKTLWKKVFDPKFVFERMEKSYLKHKIAEEELIFLEKKAVCLKEEK